MHDRFARRQEIGIVVGILLGVGFALGVRACSTEERSLVVTVTAFNSVLTRRVDVYMGLDIDKARQFGIQERRIVWRE